MLIQKLDETIAEKASHEKDASMLYKKVLFDWKQLDNEIKGRLSMFNYALLKPSGYFNQHHHGTDNPEIGMTEVFYVLSGEAMLKVNGEETKIDKGTLVVIESGDVHSMKNLSDSTPVEYVVFGISSGGPTTVVSESY